jgi:hypothetical protein
LRKVGDACAVWRSGWTGEVLNDSIVDQQLKLIFYTTVSEVIDYQRVAVLETA